MASNIWHAGLICVSPASWPDCGKVRSSWMRSGDGIGSSVKHCDITCMAGSSNHPFDSTPPETQSPVVPSRVTRRTAQPTAGFRIIGIVSLALFGHKYLKTPNTKVWPLLLAASVLISILHGSELHAEEILQRITAYVPVHCG